MEEILRKLCLAIALGELKSDRRNRLRIEGGVPFDGPEFELAHSLLNPTPPVGDEEATELRSSRVLHS